MGADWTVSPAPRSQPDPTAEQIVAERDRKRMVRTATHKLIVNMDRKTAALYAVDDEQHNLYEPGAGLTRSLLSLYESQVAQLHEVQRESGQVDPETAAFLEQLGYAGGTVDLGALQAAPDESASDDGSASPGQGSAPAGDGH